MQSQQGFGEAFQRSSFENIEDQNGKLFFLHPSQNNALC